LVNVGSGTLELGANILLNTIASGTNQAFVNFSGGTVKMLANTTGNLLLPATNGGFSGLANTIFGPLSNSTANLDGTGSASAVNGLVGATQNFAGGLTIDTDSFSTTISGPLVAPTGGGVAQANIVISAAGAGYAAPPSVRFSNPAALNATPASGYALVDNGQLVGIVITAPGCYAPTDTVTVTLSGGGASTPAVVDNIDGSTLTANVSGGLTKTGSGMLTLSSLSNSYTGPTAVNAGTLNLTGALTSNVTIANNANLAGEGSTAGSLTFAGTSNLSFDPTTAGTYLTAGSINGTAGTVTISPLSPVTGTGIVVMRAAGGITGTTVGSGNNFVYTGRGSLNLNGTSTELLLDAAPANLVWKGNDGTNPSFWDLNTTTNWDASGAEKFFSNDAVTFDDTASSFVVNINAANISSGNIVFNNTTNYTLQGAFGITGGATLTKSGTGTTTILNANTFTGATSITGGVLNIRHANALGSTVAGTTVSADAALEIQGGISLAEPITINGTGVASGGALRSVSGNNSLTAPLVMATASQVAVDADSLTVGTLSGAVGLTKSGAGTLVLTGASAATSVTVEAGTLHVGNTTGNSTAATLGANTSVTLNGSSNLTLRRSDATLLDLMGAISGSGSVTLQGTNPSVVGASQYNFNNASTYGGGTTVTNSRANLNNATGFGSGAVSVGANGGVFFAASLTVANDFNISGLGWTEASGLLGAIRLNGTTINGSITMTGDSRIAGAGTLNGVISGDYDLDFFEDTAFGTITLSGDNTYTGSTTINSMGEQSTNFPVLVVNHNFALGTTEGGTTVQGTGTTGNGGQLTLNNGINVTGETLTLDATSNGYRASLMTAASATATWDGNVLLQGTNGATGFNTAASSNLTIGASDADTITGNRSLSIRGSGVGTINSAINIGTGGFVKTDAGTWTIASNNNDFTGIASVATGTLSVGSIADSSVNSALGAGSMISLGQNQSAANGVGTLQFTGASGGSSNRSITIANGATGGGGVIENTVAGQTLTLSGAVTTTTPTSPSTLTLTGAGNGILSGGLVGTPQLSLSKSGAGTWTLSGAYNHTLTTNVTGGVLNMSSGYAVNAAGSVGKVTVNGATAVLNLAGTYNVPNGNGDAFFEIRNGGVMNFSGTAVLGNAPTGAGFRVGEASAGTLNVTAGSLTYTPISGSNFVIGRTAGANGTVNVTGGTLTVSGAGGFSIANDANTIGVLNISDTGTVNANTAIFRIGGNASTTSATVNLNAGGTLQLGSSVLSAGVSRVMNFNGGTLKAGADITVGGLTQANIKDGGAIFDSNGSTITVSQALLNDVGATTATLTKNGAGVLRLTGANTYSGATTVTAGTLELVGGSQASPVTLSAGASLGFVIGSSTVSTSSFDIGAGKIKISGTPTLNSHDLITSSSGINGIPVLDAPVPGYELKVEGTSLKLVRAGYAAWATLNGAGPNLNDDHDNDGVPNGVEYFLGGPSGTTTGFTALPGVTNAAGTLSVTWTKSADYTGVYGTDFTVETSDTLTGTWTTESISGTVTISGNNVTYTFPTPLGTKKFARLKVTGP
jgi:autotransporter-associated beta strand protein